MALSVRAASRRLLVLLLAGFASACGGDDPVEPGIDITLVTGNWAMTALAFDPQGVLPETNVLANVGAAPQLTLNADGQAQVLFRDPATNLFVTINGTFRTTANGVRLDFASNSQYRQLLLSRRMDFTFSLTARTLTFADEAPDGVLRARLVVLVPAWANEQLLDPVPGRLTVRFTKS